MLEMLVSAAGAAVKAADAVPVQVQGLSWGGFANWVLLAVATPAAVAVVRIYPKLKQLDNQKDSSLRADMLVMLQHRDARISELEKAAVEDQKRCAADMLAMEKRHDAEMESMQRRHDAAISELKGEMMGLRRNIIQEADSGKVIQIGSNAPSTRARFGEDEK